MKNKTIIISFGVIALALIIKLGLNLYVKFTTPENKDTNPINNVESISLNYNFTFDNVNYEFQTYNDQTIDKSSTKKIDSLEDVYSIKKDNKELMSLTFLPKDEAERALDQAYSSYLEETININGLNGSAYKNNGKNVAYLLRDDKYDYLWINNEYDNFNTIVNTFKKK